MKLSDLFQKEIAKGGPYATQVQNRGFLIDTITPQVAIAFGAYLQKYYYLEHSTHEQLFHSFETDLPYTVEEIWNEFLKQYNPET